jgi:EpsI family protein
MLNRAILLFVMFLSAAGLVARQSRPEAVPPRTAFDRFPMEFSGWNGQTLPPMPASVLALLGTDDLLNRVYASPERRATLGFYVGYYKSQRQGDAIHSPINCLPGAGWEPLSQGHLAIPVATAAGSTGIEVNRFVIQKGLDQQIVLYWYQSHGRVVASEYWSKFFLVRDAVRLNRTDAALVRVVVPIDPNANDGEMSAERQASDFVKAMFPLLPAYLPS